MGNGIFGKWFGKAATPAPTAKEDHPVDRMIENHRRSAEGVTPPSRASAARYVSTEDAVTLSDVYRAIQIIVTAVEQLSVDVERRGTRIEDVPAIIRRPSLDLDRPAFLAQTALSMAVDGNAYWRKIRGGDRSVVDLWLLNPHEMFVELKRNKSTGRVSRAYKYRNETIPTEDVQHISMMTLPGAAKGLGPIQAAQRELHGSMQVRDYSSNWFDGTGQPTGILSSDQPLTNEDAKRSKNTWNGLDENGEPLPATDNPSGIKVLGKGLSYEPIFINPKDAQWIEAQQFNTTRLARLFGVPASLMLAAVEGNSMTYSNVEQDWLAFTRFTLMGYLRRIEAALTELTPHGQEVRFNLEALLRADTSSRYKNHALALGRWMTEDEIRGIENLPPLTDAQREQLANTQPAAPVQEEKTNA